jgi:hypothetical protein
MAKKTKSENAPDTSPDTYTSADASAPATPKVPKEPVNDLFTRVFTKDAEDNLVLKDGAPVGAPATKKLPPQAQQIANVIEAAGVAGIRRAELVKNLVGVLVTRQPEGRILSYYQKLLVETGAVVRSN